MNFRLLYDKRRHLFHIGYNVSSERLDENHYDLLASEARIASIIAIARNEVPAGHWVHLGRPLTRTDGRHTLLSWGGTMFEYLMPALLIRSYPGTLLERSGLAAVDGQIAYARRKKIPWGISESGYFAFDADQNYQYQAFGVPELGIIRRRTDDLVVSPYASLLALSLRPRRVFKNLARLAGMGLMGPHGFYEAVDFSPARIPPGQTRAVVRSYMAHHQGMILLSLVNYLKDGIMARRFHADPVVRSIEFFLQEKVPADAPLEAVRPEDGRGGRRASIRRRAAAIPWTVPARSPAPQVHVLSNGSYSVLITNGGAGFSRWKGLDLTRWRADTTREECGTWIYCRDLETREVWSAADQPTAGPVPKPDGAVPSPYGRLPARRSWPRPDHGDCRRAGRRRRNSPPLSDQSRRRPAADRPDELRRDHPGPASRRRPPARLQRPFHRKRTSSGLERAAFPPPVPLGGRGAGLPGPHGHRLPRADVPRGLGDRPDALPGARRNAARAGGLGAGRSVDRYGRSHSGPDHGAQPELPASAARLGPGQLPDGGGTLPRPSPGPRTALPGRRDDRKGLRAGPGRGRDRNDEVGSDGDRSGTVRPAAVGLDLSSGRPAGRRRRP